MWLMSGQVAGVRSKLLALVNTIGLWWGTVTHLRNLSTRAHDPEVMPDCSSSNVCDSSVETEMDNVMVQNCTQVHW